MATNHPLMRILAIKRPSTTPESAKGYNPGVGAHCALPIGQTATITESNRIRKVGHPSEGPFSIWHKRLSMRPAAQYTPFFSCLSANIYP